MRRGRAGLAGNVAEFLAWLLARGVQPHIAVIDRRHQTRGHFTRGRFRLHLRRTSTTARKENRCAIGASTAAVKVIRTAQPQRSAKAVCRKSSVPRLPIASSSCTGKNRPGRWSGLWRALRLMSAPNELAARSKPCSLSSSNASVCAGCDCGGSGVWPSSSPSGHGAEPETAGAVPRLSSVLTCTEHCLRSEREKKKVVRANGKLRSPAAPNRPESAFAHPLFQQHRTLPAHLSHFSQPGLTSVAFRS